MKQIIITAIVLVFGFSYAQKDVDFLDDELKNKLKQHNIKIFKILECENGVAILSAKYGEYSYSIISKVSNPVTLKEKKALENCLQWCLDYLKYGIARLPRKVTMYRYSDMKILVSKELPKSQSTKLKNPFKLSKKKK